MGMLVKLRRWIARLHGGQLAIIWAVAVALSTFTYIKGERLRQTYVVGSRGWAYYDLPVFIDITCPDELWQERARLGLTYTSIGCSSTAANLRYAYEYAPDAYAKLPAGFRAAMESRWREDDRQSRRSHRLYMIGKWLKRLPAVVAPLMLVLSWMWFDSRRWPGT